MSTYSIYVRNTNTLFLALFLLCFSTITGETSFDFQTLTTFTNLKLLGDAHIYNNTIIRLTGDFTVPNSGSGRVFYNKPIRFRQPGNQTPTSFTTHFSFCIVSLNPNSIGGGLAFVISPDDESIGAAGGFLGIPDGAVAIEFDTVKDVEFKDVNGNHVGLDIDSVVSLYVADLDLVNVNLKSGELIHSWVDYSGSTQQLNVFISLDNIKPKSPVLSITINLYQYVNEFMFVGFAGSTQGSTEDHSVESWSFSSSFYDPDTKPVGSNSQPPPLVAIVSTPDTYTIRKNRKLNKLIKGLVGALFGIIVTTGGITIYLKYSNRDQNKYCNICNCCSNVNNVAV